MSADCVTTYHRGKGRGYTGERKTRFNPSMHKDWGSPPPGMVWMHTCHNKLCSNKDHIRLGTRSENMLDSDVSTSGDVNFFSCGHPRVEENMYSGGAGQSKRCAACKREREHKGREDKGRPVRVREKEHRGSEIGL